SHCYQPVIQPSTSKPVMPLAAAKSIYFLALAVVAPCLPPAMPQVALLRCISHQMPTYLAGFIQSVSAILEGSLRFSIRCDSIKAPAVFPRSEERRVGTARRSQTRGSRETGN